ncbi:MAG: autotransporter-associated beta strand repeat-containing protein [Verrucomicrobiota bacterium]
MLRIGAGASSPLNGTVTLSGINTYSGGTVIEAPHTLQVSASGSLGSASGALSFSNAVGRGYGTLNLNGADVMVGNLSGAGGTILNNKSGTNNVFTIGNGDASGGVFQGVILNGSGSISLVKTGAGTITLAATNTWTGGTQITEGALQLGDGTTRNGVLLGNITNNATLIIANPQTQVFANAVSGAGTMIKSGAGRLTLAGANTYTGKTTISSGILALVDSSDLSSSPMVEILAGATLDVTGRTDGEFAIGNARTIMGNGSVLWLPGGCRRRNTQTRCQSGHAYRQRKCLDGGCTGHGAQSHQRTEL